MPHPNPCNVCDTIRTAPNKPNTILALQASTTESTVRRHRGYLAAQDTDEVFGIPRVAITSRGMSYYDPEKGWEKITYNPNKAALVALGDYYDDFEKALADTPTTQPPATSHSGLVAVFCPSDIQMGKADLNGDSFGTIERVLKATNQFVQDCAYTRPDEVVIAELGDVVENFNNTPTQRAVNHMDLTTQVRTARRLLLEVIKRLRTCAPRITYAAVTSNHGAVRIEGTKALASTPGNDWGIEISHQIQDALFDRAEYSHVRFVRPETEFDDALTYTATNGVRIGMVHGDKAKTPEKMGDYWRGLAFGRRNGLQDADLLLHGHFHHLSLSQMTDDRWIIGTASSDPGSAWWTNVTGVSATAGVTAFDLHAGRSVPWSNLRIL